jgi:butyryl-CoA dehydrogenase
MDFQLSADQRALQDRALRAGRELRHEVPEWDRTNKVPYQRVVQHIADHGLLGLAMPKQYGGQGLTALEYFLVVESLFRGSQFWVVGEPVFATTGPGPSMLLLAENEATREKFLPDIVAGRRQCAIALTEPDYGSDLTSLETTAVRDGRAFIVNGVKSFVTGAVENDLYAVFTRFDDIPGHKGIGAVIIEAGTPGFTIEAGPEFVGCRGVPHGNLTMEDVRIPSENIVVGPGSFGKLMSAFNMERLHNCAFNLGMAEAAYDEAVTYVEKRQAFGRKIVEFQYVYHSLVDMWTDIEALRALAQRAASSAIDGNFPRAFETTTAKLFGARVASQITLRSLELHGGHGATTDSAIQRIHRDVVATIVAGGSPPVLRNSLAMELLPGHRFSQRNR